MGFVERFGLAFENAVIDLGDALQFHLSMGIFSCAAICARQHCVAARKLDGGFSKAMSAA
jgi:hypothetical protein